MKRSFTLLSVLLLVTLSAGCSSPKSTPEEAAEKLFLAGERQMERGLWSDALSSWEQVRDTFYSPELSMLAEFKIAETYYLSGQYPEAVTAYSGFLQRHPNDFRTPVVLYRLGQSYYRQILSRDRDQTNTRNAQKIFEQLLQRFPDSHNAEQAAQMILRCKTRIADHEVYVGRFYLQRKQYQPAIQRFESVLAQFPDYYYRDEAFFYLGQTYLRTGQVELAQDLFNKLLEQFPASTYYDKTRKLLSQLG